MISFIEKYKKEFVLVGGTAIALQIGHRKSIDFDLFKPNSEYLDERNVTKHIKKTNYTQQKTYSNDHQQHRVINEVNCTRFAYLFDIPQNNDLGRCRIPSLLHLAAMKCHALSGRSKWKDYVDIFHIIQEYGLKKILDYTQHTFNINPKLICNQLCYHEDINYEESVERIAGKEIDEEIIKRTLIKESLAQLN